MPNHVTQRVALRARYKKDLKLVVRSVFSVKASVIDCHRVIPRPRSLSITSGGTVADALWLFRQRHMTVGEAFESLGGAGVDSDGFFPRKPQTHFLLEALRYMELDGNYGVIGVPTFPVANHALPALMCGIEIQSFFVWAAGQWRRVVDEAPSLSLDSALFGGLSFQDELRATRAGVSADTLKRWRLARSLIEGVVADHNMRVYGAKDWYDWSIENWGTKWGCYDGFSYRTDRRRPSLSTIARIDGGYELEFGQCSAWDWPLPVFQALVERFPFLSVCVEAIDEGWGFADVAEWCDGEFAGVSELSCDASCEDFREVYRRVYGGDLCVSDGEELDDAEQD